MFGLSWPPDHDSDECLGSPKRPSDGPWTRLDGKWPILTTFCEGATVILSGGPDPCFLLVCRHPPDPDSDECLGYLGLRTLILMNVWAISVPDPDPDECLGYLGFPILILTNVCAISASRP